MPQAETSLRSVAVLTWLTLGQMVLQFCWQILLAHWFGTASEMDALVAANTLPMVVSGLLAGAIGSAFVPVYVETRERVGETAAWSMAVQLLCGLFLLVVLLWQAARLFAEPIMHVLHPGFDEEQVSRTGELFQTLASLMVWQSLTGLARAWNHCHGRFARTGLAAVMGNAVTLALAWQGGAGQGMDKIAQAVTIGALVTFAAQMPWLQIFSRGWPVTPESQAAVQRCVRLALPLMVGLACTQLDPLLDRYLTSQLAPGCVSQLGYASRLASAVLTLSVSGLSVVVFPSLARHAAERNDEKLRTELAAALRWLAVVLIPMVVCLVGFGSALVRDLLERGRFQANDTQVVSLLLAILCGMMIGGSVGEIAAKVFYSEHNARTPVIVGVVGLGIGAALKFAWVEAYGVVGLATATSLYYLLNAGTLLTLIAIRLRGGVFRGLFGTVWRVSIGSAAAASVGACLVRSSLPLPAVWGGVAGGVTLLAVLIITREEFSLRAVRWLLPSRCQEPAS